MKTLPGKNNAVPDIKLLHSVTYFQASFCCIWYRHKTW